MSFGREKPIRCQADKCALWKWSDGERSAAMDAFFMDAMAELGFKPGSKPNSLTVTQAKNTARENMKGWTGHTGYCGLTTEQK